MARAGFYAIENSTIRFGRDGLWYADGQPIENRRIANLFSRHVECADDGTYKLRIGPEEVSILVDDTPHVVVSVALHADESLDITLNDDTVEPLDTRSLEVGADEVLYCKVKEGRERARFLRPAYYQLAPYIVETAPGQFGFRKGRATHAIQRR